MNIKTPVIIVGHYGSGKTEFVSNYALHLKRQGFSPVVADMDIVNPYFRMRELKADFESKGIKIVSSNYEDEVHLDMPALSASLQACFENKDQFSIVDVGGDPAGATVLARYSKLVSSGEYNMWMTVNANRPQTSTAEDALTYLKAIEQMSRMKINGLINTTHMLRETGKEDIRRGDDLIRSLSALSNLPVVYTVVEKSLLSELEEEKLAGILFPIQLTMRPDWL